MALPKLAVSLPSIPDGAQPWLSIAVSILALGVLFILSIWAWYALYKLFFGGVRRAVASLTFLTIGLWSGLVSPTRIFRYLDSAYVTNPVVTLFVLLLSIAPSIWIIGFLMSASDALPDDVAASNSKAEQYRQWQRQQDEMGWG
jgi:hypothetical protein